MAQLADSSVTHPSAVVDALVLHGLAVNETYYVQLQARDSTAQSRYSAATQITTASGGVKRYYYGKDHLGSVRVTVTASGEVVQASDYDPFGLELSGRSMAKPDAPVERYTGHELDEETDLYYAGARYLDPVIGRWLIIDPLASDFPEHSPYSYVEGNPISLIDPTGMSSEEIHTGLEDALKMAEPHIRCMMHGDCSGVRSTQDVDVDKTFSGDEISQGIQYMWTKSNSGGKRILTPVLSDNVAREVAAYLTLGENGRPILFVFNSMGNTSTSSLNPSVEVASNGTRTFQGNKILAQLHTHPNFEQADGTTYSAHHHASNADRAVSRIFPVLTITENTIGVTVGGGGTRDWGNSFRDE